MSIIILLRRLSFLNKHASYNFEGSAGIKDKLDEKIIVYNVYVYKRNETEEMAEKRYGDRIEIMIVDSDKYDEMTIMQLTDKLKKCNLKTTGNKAELIERLKRYNQNDDNIEGSNEDDVDDGDLNELRVDDNEVIRRFVDDNMGKKCVDL